MSDSTWQIEVPGMPDERQFWFFYGTCDFERQNGKKPSLRVVRVSAAGAADRRFTIMVVDGAFMYPKEEGWEGFWKRIPTPEAPSS